MFEQTEVDEIEWFRGTNSKLAFNKLKVIYENYTGETVKGCGCGKQERTVFLTMFYEWYEENS